MGIIEDLQKRQKNNFSLVKMALFSLYIYRERKQQAKITAL